MPTGGTIVTNITVSTNPGYGQIEVEYHSAADQNHPTTYRLNNGSGWSAPVAVNPYNSSNPVSKFVANYWIDFQRTTNNPVDTVPPLQVISVVQNQRTNVKVRYV